MNPIRTTVTLAFAVSLLMVAGCGFLKKEEGANRTILKAGWQVSDDMEGWVAVPNSAPKESKSEKGVGYYILSTHNIVPAKMDGFQAFSPKAFEKLSGIKVAEQKTPEGEMWAMRPAGRSVPKEKDGWIGVPLKYPKVEGGAGAILGADQLIPKEMDGWVAIDKETSAKLVEEFTLNQQTINKRKSEDK
ncbi:MAG: hypothetical protein KIS92_11735 [Planctomycetota bacterium]|nr:hypothetical protein [Planctomycetota bacterium]